MLQIYIELVNITVKGLLKKVKEKLKFRFGKP